jgi:Na+/phosphate symporter
MVVASPFGPDARRLARLHLALAVCGTVVLVATVDGWAYLADRLVAGRPEELEYGKKVLLPHMARHLVVGFALSQIAVTLLLAGLIQPVTKVLQTIAANGRSGAAARKLSHGLSGEQGIGALRAGLVRAFQSQRRALVSIFELCTTGHRERGRKSEHTLADARAELEGLFKSAVQTAAEDAELGKLRQAALATVQLQRALEDLLRHAERSTEQRIGLSPAGASWSLPPRDEATLKALHQLLMEGMDALVGQVENADSADIDGARAREIRLNAMESETRQELLTEANDDVTHAIALRLNSADLVNAYESVGNHIYRLSEALSPEVDQEV